MAGREFAVYNSDQIIIQVAKIPIQLARAEDEFLTLESEEDDITTHSSADGSGAISVNNNRWSKATIKMSHLAQANKVLSGIYKAQKLLSSGVVIVPFSVVDIGSQGNLFATPQAAFLRFPDEALTKAKGDIEWPFVAYDAERFIAGH